MPFPPHLLASGTDGRPFEAVLDLAELPPGAMRRVTRGELDVLLAHTPDGIVATDDRCPHMSAPLSIGELDGCVVACPLHEGRFDLCTGDPVQMPTTGGLDPDGVYHPTWSPAGRDPKVDPPGKKAEARRLTRVRRLRYYPVRIADGVIEVRPPGASRAGQRSSSSEPFGLARGPSTRSCRIISTASSGSSVRRSRSRSASADRALRPGACRGSSRAGPPSTSRADQHDREVADLAGLDQRQRLEQLVERAEAAGQDHERRRRTSRTSSCGRRSSGTRRRGRRTG